MRTIIELPEDQLASLDLWCRAEGVSRAEGIRRAVGAMLERSQSARGRQAFGLWRERKTDGVAYQRAIRREWDR